jgi:gluconate 5-dehydrogenase
MLDAPPPHPGALFDLAGQVALVTGASRGLGWAVAQTLAAAGARVVLTGRNSEPLAQRLQQLADWGLSAETVAFDAGDADATIACIAGIEARHGRLDILYSNTAASVRKPFVEQSEEEWQQALDGSLTSGWRLARHAAPLMARAGYGRIIFVSSINAKVVRPTMSGYAAAKAGLEGLVRSLALELAPSGITVNAIEPGYFLTDGNSATRAADPAFHQRIANRIPAGRWGNPPELAAAALYLASRAASFTTGSVITVDGGMTIAI